MLPPLPRCSGWAYSSLIAPSRVSLPRKGRRVGLHIVLFEACSAFTRVAACTLARSPYFVTRYPKASDISSPPCLLRLLPAGAVAGWDLHPLENAAFQTSRPRWKALRSPLLNAETPSSRLSITGCNPLQAEWATGKGTFVRTFSVRARHQPDFEWRAERESCTVNPVQEYAPIRAELCDQASLAACRARCGSESVTLAAPAVVAIGVDMPAISGCRSEGSSDGAVGLRPS